MENPCPCGTQRPCPEDGCIAYKKYHGIELDKDEQVFEDTMRMIKSMAKDKTPPYKDALELWGEDSQFGMMFEESAELIEQVAKFQKALNQFRRGRINLEELVEELIDTEIMLQEMKVVLHETTGQDVDTLCKEMWKKKVAKFQSQVDAEKEKRGL